METVLRVKWFVRVLIFLLCCVAPTTYAGMIKLDTNTGFASVYLVERPGDTHFTVSLTVLAGEVDVTGAAGLSHYLEHLMYWHADNADTDAWHARTGNAWVNGLVTSYYNQGEQAELDSMLEFISRLFTPPTLDRGFAVRERSVVAREYDVGVSENPDHRAYTKIRKNLYYNHPVSRSVIGTPQSIAALTLAQATLFQRRFYSPANSVLFLAGNLSKTKAETLVNDQFGKLVPGNLHAAEWRNAKIDSATESVQEFVEPQANHERLIYLTLADWPGLERGVKDWYTLSLLQSVLNSALEGGIARPLRMDEFVLSSFSMSLVSPLQNYFEFQLFAQPDKGVSLERATKTITDTLITLADKGIPQKTLDRVRGRMLQTENRSIDYVFNNYGRLAEQLSAGLNPVTSTQHIEHIESVTLEEVNKLLKALAKPVRRSVAFIKPAGE